MPQGTSHWQQHRPLIQGQAVPGPTISPLHAMAGSFTVVFSAVSSFSAGAPGFARVFFWAPPPRVIPLIIPAFIR